MIHNLLCDIGNVLLAFDFAPAVARLNHRADLSQEAAAAAVIHLRDQMECGALAADEFLAALRDELAYPGTDDEARAIYADIFTPIEPVWEMVRAMHAAGMRLVLFSNISPIHADHISARYASILGLFGDAVFSYRTGALKPDDGMYLEAIGKLGLDPAESIYLDDNAANIATGARFGFHTHCYDLHRHAALREELARLRLPGA